MYIWTHTHTLEFSVSESAALATEKLTYSKESIRTNYWQYIQQKSWTYYLLIYAVTVESKHRAHIQETDLEGHSGYLDYLNCVKSWYGDMGAYLELLSSAQFISDIN